MVALANGVIPWSEGGSAFDYFFRPIRPKTDQGGEMIYWERPEGGGGRSRVMTGGRVFEQGGVNFSEVEGTELPPSILSQRPEAKGHRWYATGTSMVLHPRNPYIPTVHLNYQIGRAHV